MFHSGDFFFLYHHQLFGFFISVDISLCFCLPASAATYKVYTDKCTYIILSSDTKQMQSSTTQVSYYLIIITGSFASGKKKDQTLCESSWGVFDW